MWWFPLKEVLGIVERLHLAQAFPGIRVEEGARVRRAFEKVRVVADAVWCDGDRALPVRWAPRRVGNNSEPELLIFAEGWLPLAVHV